MLSRPIIFLLIVFIAYFSGRPTLKIGDVIDQLDGVPVYYNGKNFAHSSGRHKADDGYNFGLKFQCVEFVKRYYYYHYNHKMPNTYGNAKDYFDDTLGDFGFNSKRGLYQYRNIREFYPMKGDILVYGPYDGNPFGHVAIVSKANSSEIEIIQQNWGLVTRKIIKVVNFNDIITVADYHVKGWLRKE